MLHRCRADGGLAAGSMTQENFYKGQTKVEGRSATAHFHDWPTSLFELQVAANITYYYTACMHICVKQKTTTAGWSPYAVYVPRQQRIGGEQLSLLSTKKTAAGHL